MWGRFCPDPYQSREVPHHYQACWTVPAEVDLIISSLCWLNTNTRVLHQTRRDFLPLIYPLRTASTTPSLSRNLGRLFYSVLSAGNAVLWKKISANYSRTFFCSFSKNLSQFPSIANHFSSRLRTSLGETSASLCYENTNTFIQGDQLQPSTY